MAAVSVLPDLMFDELDMFLLEMEQHDQLSIVGVASEGEAAAYALVWEWGNARQTKVGPRTTVGINPDGEKVFLSLQAPLGYIRVNEPLFWSAVESELEKVKFDGAGAGSIRDVLDTAAIRIAKRIVKIIRDHVPIDTGALQESIVVVPPQDMLLADTSNRYETLDMNIEADELPAE